MAIIDFKSLFGKKAQEPEQEPMHPAIADISRLFSEADIKYSIDHSMKQWDLIAGISGQHNSYQLKFIVKDDSDNDLAIRIFSLVRCPDDKRKAMCKFLNELNAKYRYVKFAIDDSNSVSLEADLPSCTTNPGEVAVEYFIRVLKIVDDIYPDLMRALWS